MDSDQHNLLRLPAIHRFRDSFPCVNIKGTPLNSLKLKIRSLSSVYELRVPFHSIMIEPFQTQERLDKIWSCLPNDLVDVMLVRGDVEIPWLQNVSIQHIIHATAYNYGYQLTGFEHTALYLYDHPSEAPVAPTDQPTELHQDPNSVSVQDEDPDEVASIPATPLNDNSSQQNSKKEKKGIQPKRRIPESYQIYVLRKCKAIHPQPMTSQRIAQMAKEEFSSEFVESHKAFIRSLGDQLTEGVSLGYYTVVHTRPFALYTLTDYGMNKANGKERSCRVIKRAAAVKKARDDKKSGLSN